MKDSLWYFELTVHTRVQSHEKADNEASVKWKEVKGKPDKISELILKRTADLKEGPGDINSHPWIVFSFNWLYDGTLISGGGHK